MLAIFARPFDPQIPVALEGVEEPDFGDVPGDAADKNLAGVDGVAIDSGRQGPAPDDGGVADGGGVAVEARRPFDRVRVVGGSRKQLVGARRPVQRPTTVSAAVAVVVIRNEIVRPAAVVVVMAVGRAWRWRIAKRALRRQQW